MSSVFGPMSTTSRTTGRPGSRSPSSPRTTRPQRRPVCHHSSDYTAGTRYSSATSRHPPPLTKAGPPPAQPIRGDCRPPPAYAICRSPCRLPLRTISACLLEPATVRAVGRRGRTSHSPTKGPSPYICVCVFLYFYSSTCGPKGHSSSLPLFGGNGGFFT